MLLAAMFGPSARGTSRWLVPSEDGQASACPRAYLKVYFPNARSAVGNSGILELAEAKRTPPPHPGRTNINDSPIQGLPVVALRFAPLALAANDEQDDESKQ